MSTKASLVPDIVVSSNDSARHMPGLLEDNDWVSAIYRMLTSLACVCDNAEKKDFAGFSKADLIGHYISELPRSFFNRDWAITSLLLIRKYKRQLEGFGYQVGAYTSLLGEIEQDELNAVRKNRASRQLRRLRVRDDGSFEIYFPNRASMDGFNRFAPVSFDWIIEEEIPHGYQFVVQPGARAYAMQVFRSYPDWLIDGNALAILKDESLDTIDVSGAIVYDLYIEGNSIDEELVLRWDNLNAFLSLVRTFSKRRFDDSGPCWRVQLKTIEDLELLERLIATSGASVFVSAPLLKALEDTVAYRASLQAGQARNVEESRPRGIVTHENGAFHIRFTRFDPSLVDWIKSNLNKREFRKEAISYWVIQENNENIIALSSILESPEWEFPVEVAHYIRSTQASATYAVNKEIADAIEAARVSYLKVPDNDFTYSPDIINGSLLPFQPVVLQYSTIRKNMLIGDDMGLGKSLAALACAAYHALADSVVITCPAIARLTWRDEIRKWLPGKTYYICRKANSKKNAMKEWAAINAADFVIASYNKLSVYSEVLAKKKAKLYIGDESQYLKNPKAQRTMAAMTVSAACEVVYLLSGTAIKNRPIELIPQLRMLRVLDSGFGGEMAFKFSYCGATNNGWGWNFDGSSNLDELRRKLREQCMVRRLKDEVMEFLPEKRRIRVPVEIPNRAEYDQAGADFMMAVRQRAQEVLAAEADDLNLEGKKKEKYISENIAETIARSAKAKMFVHTEILRKLVARGLQEPACEWIETFCESGDPLVVFAFHDEQTKFIYNHLKENTSLRVGRIVSSMKDEARKAVETDFQADKYDVVVCALLTANTNITLVAATNVLIVEYWWVSGDLIQAEDRCRRIGTSLDVESINCYYLHAEDTVDDLFWDAIVSKFDVIQKSLDTDEGAGFDNINEEVRSSILSSMMEKYDFVKYADQK